MGGENFPEGRLDIKIVLGEYNKCAYPCLGALNDNSRPGEFVGLDYIKLMNRKYMLVRVD